jgi:hypothetical protein
LDWVQLGNERKHIDVLGGLLIAAPDYHRLGAEPLRGDGGRLAQLLLWTLERGSAR